MSDEYMKQQVTYNEQDFDLCPLGVSDLTGNELIDLGTSCNQCRAPLSPRGDFGYLDFTLFDGDEDYPPEWVPLCFKCARPIVYAETDTVDPRTGKRATDGLEAV